MAPAARESLAATPTAAAQRASIIEVPVAGLLAWAVPGLGHIYLGQRVRGIICLVTITLTFWTGVAIGSVQGTVDPKERSLWFMAQLCTGGNTLAAYGWNRILAPPPSSQKPPTAVAQWVSVDVGVHYTGVAGLLNLLVILDALSRAELRASPSRGARDRPKGVT